MNHKFDELINQAGFSSTYERDRLYQLIRLTALECARIVNHSPTMNYKYPAFSPGSYITHTFGIQDEQNQDQ
jgi:hypothetical protein